MFAKQYFAPLAALAVYFLARPRDGSLADHLVIVVPLVMMLLGYSLFAMRPRLADESA